MDEEKIDELIAAVRVGNALTLAQAMGLDASNPVDIGKALRYLTLVESRVKRDSDD